MRFQDFQAFRPLFYPLEKIFYRGIYIITSILFFHITLCRKKNKPGETNQNKKEGAVLTSIIITITCFLTAALSGVFGLGGGILLMGFWGLFLHSVCVVLHGIIQAFSNGSRAYFLRSHIQWKLLPVYALGVLTALILCSFLSGPLKNQLFLLFSNSFLSSTSSLVNLTLN